jgi:hypothetical protein
VEASPQHALAFSAGLLWSLVPSPFRPMPKWSENGQDAVPLALAVGGTIEIAIAVATATSWTDDASMAAREAPRNAH